MKAVEITIFGLLAVIIGFAIYDNELPLQASPSSPAPAAPSLVGAAQAAPLTPLLPKSACGHVMVSCADDIFRPVWIKLISSVGEITKIDSNFRTVGSGAVLVYAYSFVPNTVFDAHKLRRLVFDCAGQYYDDTDGAGEPMDAPPGSIAGQIASLACAKLKSIDASKAHLSSDN